MKGGGDPTSAARAVIQTGEYDFAWNLQVEDDILKRMEQGGKGRVDFAVSGNIEHVNVNQTDPWTEVDGERSSIKTKHPLLSDPAVRQALSLVIDRASMQEQLYGRAGQATATTSTLPAASSRRTRGGSSTSRRPTRSSTTPAGSAGPTASARRTASD